MNLNHSVGFLGEVSISCISTYFYMLPKIHKPNNPGRPIGNGIGSITEKISAYVDQEIRHVIYIYFIAVFYMKEPFLFP